MSDELQLARLLFPALVSELDDAFAVHATEPNLADTADAAIAAAVQQFHDTELGRTGFDAFEVPGRYGDISTKVAVAFDEVRRIMTWIGGDVPEPEAFVAAGVDAGKLGTALAGNSDLAIVPAPHGIGAEGWRSLFRAAARQPGSQLSLADPLVLAEEIALSFPVLDEVPDGVVRVPIDATGDSKVYWTLRAIPSGAAPAVLGLSHLHGPHVTIAEMLMLQLMRLTRGADPLDARSFTWLDGVLTDGRFAARHVFDAGERNVRVTSREVGNQGPHLGARPPVG